MGLYINITHLESKIPAGELVELADRALPKDGVADTAVVNAAIDAAEARLHRSLPRRYQLPLSAADEILMGVIRPILVDFTWVELHPRADMVSDALQQRCDNHEAYLQAIRDGKDDLPASAPPPAPGTGPGVLYTTSPRVTQGGMP